MRVAGFGGLEAGVSDKDVAVMLSGDRNTHGQCFQLIRLHLPALQMIASHLLGLLAAEEWCLQLLSQRTAPQNVAEMGGNAYPSATIKPPKPTIQSLS